MGEGREGVPAPANTHGQPRSLQPVVPVMKVSVVESAVRSVIPTEAEGSRAVCDAQAQASRMARKLRLCIAPSMRPEEGARSLRFGRDDGRGLCFIFVQRGGSNGPVNIWHESSGW